MSNFVKLKVDNQWLLNCLIYDFGEELDVYLPWDGKFECIHRYGNKMCIIIECFLNHKYEKLPFWIPERWVEKKNC